MAKGLMRAPSSWLHWYYFGREICRTPTPEAAALGSRCLTQAGHYDLNNYRLWKQIGKYRLSRKDYAGAREAYARVHELRDWVPIPDIPEAAP
jgi:hypothetical protein